MQNVVLKLGGKGCLIKNADERIEMPVYPHANCIDTTGAGDIFGGSAVWKLLQLGKDPAELTQEQLQDVVCFACTAAGLSTTKPGGISSVPEYEDVLRAKEGIC